MPLMPKILKLMTLTRKLFQTVKNDLFGRIASSVFKYAAENDFFKKESSAALLDFEVLLKLSLIFHVVSDI